MQNQQQLIEQITAACPFHFNQEELDKIKARVTEAHEQFGWVEEHDYPLFNDMIVAVEDFKNRRYSLVTDKCRPGMYGASHIVLCKPRNVFEKELAVKLEQTEIEYRTGILDKQDAWIDEQVNTVLAEQEAEKRAVANAEQQVQTNELKSLFTVLLNS